MSFLSWSFKIAATREIASSYGTFRFVVFGEKHLRYLVSEYVDYDHRCRPHQSLDNLPPGMTIPPDPVECLGPKGVMVRQRLGGLLNHYERKAA